MPWCETITCRHTHNQTAAAGEMLNLLSVEYRGVYVKTVSAAANMHDYT
jgi:hypothetical protein